MAPLTAIRDRPVNGASATAAGHGETSAQPSQADRSRPEPEPVSRGAGDHAPRSATSGPRSNPQRRRMGAVGIFFRAIGAIFSTAFRTADWVISLILPVQAYRSWRGARRSAVTCTAQHRPFTCHGSVGHKFTGGSGILARILGGGSMPGNQQPVSRILAQAYGDAILRFRDGRWQQRRRCMPATSATPRVHSL